MNAQRLHKELVACGCAIISLDAFGNISEWSGAPNPTLAALVLDAHEKAMDSTEVIALQTALGVTSPEWAAYVIARKEPIRIARANAYLKDALVKILEMFAGAEYTISGDGLWIEDVRYPKSEAAKVKEVVETVKAALPYL